MVTPAEIKVKFGTLSKEFQLVQRLRLGLFTKLESFFKESCFRGLGDKKKLPLVKWQVKTAIVID